LGIGLSEAHQALRVNDLRGKVRVQTDGGLKTGLDVIKAAILGAESFGFGSTPMIALGCKYLRICHLNNCATGVATQQDHLRQEHYIGEPEMLINFFKFIAEETREWLAALGVASLKDLIGRVDLLEVLPGETEKHAHLDLSALLTSHPLLKVKLSIAKFKVMRHLIKVYWLRKWLLKCYQQLKQVQVVHLISLLVTVIVQLVHVFQVKSHVVMATWVWKTAQL
jgi:hypothetical protein